MMSASKTLKKNLSIAVTAVFLAVAAFACWAIEPSKAYADTTDSHLTVASEVHVLVDSEGNVTIPNATVTNDGTCAAYIMGCSSPDGLGWTCDAVGKRIEVGQSITATWRSAGPVSDEIAAQLGEEPYYAGNLTYTYTDGDLKGTVSLDNTDPTVGDTITATVTGANVPDDKLTYRWVKVKDGSETSIDGATGSTYTATDDDAGYELVCKVSSTDDICQGTISGATGAVKKIQAFAVYSADDGSLNFYKRAIAELPSAGEQFNGKTATAVYTGIEDTNGSQPWREYMSDIKTATVVDSGIQPKNTAFWFSRCANMTQFDASKLDVSQTTTASSMFNGCSSLTDLSSIASWNVSKVTNMGSMFLGCSKLPNLDLSGWNPASITDTGIRQMFDGCSSLASIKGISSWDTSNITAMYGVFWDCKELVSLDLSGWDCSKVTSTSVMFTNCRKLQEITVGDKWQWVAADASGYLPTPSSQYITGATGKWYDEDGNGYAPADIPTGKAATYYASKDLVPGITISGNAEVGETLTATVNNLSEEEITGYQWYTVDDSNNETAIANATAHTYTVTANEVGKKILCKAFYKNGSATKNVKTTSTDNVTPQKTAFAVYSADDNSLDFYKRSSVPSAGEQFEGKTATKVYKGIEDTNRSVPWSNYKRNIKTATVVDDEIQPKSTVQWFYNFSNMTQCDMSKLDTSNLTDMSDMFYNCSKLTSVGDLSSWNTPKVTTIYGMFSSCSALTTLDLSSWNTSKVTNMNSMFSSCSSLTTLDLSSWNTSKVASMNYMFDRCSSLTTLDLSSWNISSVTTMQSMFDRCSALTTLDLSSWNTSNLTRAPMMFSSCSALTSVGDLSGWNTSKVTNMSYMFNGCKSLTSVGDLSSWNTSNLASASCMFYNCSKLTSVGDLSSWNTSNVASMNYMFTGCSALTSVGDLSGWNTSKVTNMNSMFSGCSRLSADCSNWDVSKVTNHSNFNTNAPGVILPSAWQTSSDEDVEDSAIAPLCEDQENGDALSVSSGNNNEDATKTDGEASADSETVGSATTSADDVGAKEEASDDIVQEELVAA